MMEIAFKIFVFCLEFFHHKFGILDSINVVVSFVLDIILLFQEHEFEALGLLILLWLLCLAKIIDGTIILVKTRSEQQLMRLKQINTQLAAKIQHLELSCSEKEQEIERLNKLLATARTAWQGKLEVYLLHSTEWSARACTCERG
ncbi:hypothetical protein HJG60_011702 [Phyllostomus discolor]|uniref:Voltage-gated hydrogen channel 1 C-terminal membrane-localisation domain-containing protein n=1 Tax=Phyllostomus discolor TaxID=89673 RepID=A0A834E105_9CHIR|nr:hypothetical protein HJG60_011702 [Phyllostomus discolor]